MNPARYSKEAVKREVEGFGLQVDVDRDWQDIVALRKAWEALGYLGFNEDAPAESVYQTAIQVRLQRLNDALDPDGNPRWFYRGQRSHRWDAVPKIFRGLRDEPKLSWSALLEERLRGVRSVVARMIRAGLTTDEFEATAIAQHYSSELGVRTWLLDVTESPWIALFFASDGGKAGETGTLEYIELGEWMLFSNRGETALGAIRVAQSTSVPRIRNQQAFFLQAPHPDLLRALVNRKLYFLQQDGVVFESDAFDEPLTRGLIYPRRDPTLAALHELPSESHEAGRLMWEPTVAALRAPDYQVFLPVARALLERGADRNPIKWKESCLDWDEVLEQLCRLHATVSAHHEKDDVDVTSLHQLRSSVEHVLLLGDQLGVSRFIESCYLNRLHGDKTRVATFHRCLQDASPFWAAALEANVDDHMRWPQRKA